MAAAWYAFAQAPQVSVSETAARAKQIVAEFSPDKKIWVRSFSNGLRAVGTSFDEAAALPRAHGSVQISCTLPEWVHEKSLLHPLASPDSTIRLLWQVEPRLTPKPESVHIAAKYINHQGYASVAQRDEQSSLDVKNVSYGSVAWTEHAMTSLRVCPPGLYDLVVSNTTLPRESIPLGQILWKGSPEHREEDCARATELFPNGACLFAGSAVLARWFTLTVPVKSLPFIPRELVIVSSVDWLEAKQDGTGVADVVAVVEGKQSTPYAIVLGRDTSSTWYDFHARGNVQHSQAPIAWSWRERQESVDFEASAYLARFDFSALKVSPESVSLQYVGDEGVLRVYAILLLP